MQGQTFKIQRAQEAYSLQLLSKRTIHSDKESNFICILLESPTIYRKKKAKAVSFDLKFWSDPGSLQAHLNA